MLGKEFVEKSIASADDDQRAEPAARAEDACEGALRNGLTREEIREVLLQVGIYCGVPAAVDSFRVAREALNEFDQGK